MTTDPLENAPAQATSDHSIARDVRFRAVFDEGVVVRQRAAEVLVLNTVGIRILDLIAKDRSTGEIVDDLSAEFDASKDELHSDLSAFIGELVAAGVLESSTPASAGDGEVKKP